VISPGRLLLKCRQRLRGGLRTSYWREVVRPRILRTAPVAGTNDPQCEIHVLTSANDWLDLLWALKSFYHNSGRCYRLCIHDDGTLGPERMATLAAHFPHGRVISRTEADAEVLPALVASPRCHEFRRTNHLAPKVFDFAYYLTAERMMLLDSDVLFFAEPTALVKRIEDARYRKNTVNGDVASAYTVEPATVRERTGVELIERFNSGLGLIHKDSLRLDWLEEFLALPGIIGHFWRIEQTLFALCSSRFGAERLPPEYDVRLTGEVGGAPSRHYVGAIRHLLYKEGIVRLVRGGFLREPAASARNL
jgi:hypothetical protein